MTTASGDPKPPPMSEVDWTNMVRRAAMELERERKSAAYELIGRVLHNVERIADALESSADSSVTFARQYDVRKLFEADKS